MKNHEAASKTFVIFCRDITFAFNNVQQKTDYCELLLKVITTSSYLSLKCVGVFSYLKSDNVVLY